MGRLITATPAVAFGAVWVLAIAWAIDHRIRGGKHRTRRGIRRLEHYANHPGVRAAEQRKEKP